MTRTRLRAALVALAVAAGWWATALEPFSHPATAFVLVTGAAAMVVGGRRWSAPAHRSGAVAPWAVVTGALAGWQLAAYLQHPRSDHPTLSSLTNAALDARPARAAAFAAWLLACAWLARR